MNKPKCRISRVTACALWNDLLCHSLSHINWLLRFSVFDNFFDKKTAHVLCGGLEYTVAAYML